MSIRECESGEMSPQGTSVAHMREYICGSAMEQIAQPLSPKSIAITMAGGFTATHWSLCNSSAILRPKQLSVKDWSCRAQNVAWRDLRYRPEQQTAEDQQNGSEAGLSKALKPVSLPGGHLCKTLGSYLLVMPVQLLFAWMEYDRNFNNMSNNH